MFGIFLQLIIQLKTFYLELEEVSCLLYFITWYLSLDLWVRLNTMTKKQVGEEKVYLAYTSTLLFITEGSQDRNSNRAGTWRQELMEGPCRGTCFLACSPWPAQSALLTEPRTTSPGMPSLIMGRVFPHQSQIKKMPYIWISWRHFSQLSFLLFR